ncbi:ABC transporter ATP-binding protein [Thalassovita taeanensis]|uniref:Peptide/nickel transport system ATP-binding protein n=1 Tax=Thalassovita taeanensis TaxID=657014 RepID=A0A1H9JWH5_9RHOB|nr:ABC transporter ATP-binding protein [Thalassovita taeanensis]SEQ91147.1 peptide/nickel transport system ATP-binding protein [Thalassovita taeanensis]
MQAHDDGPRRAVATHFETAGPRLAVSALNISFDGQVQTVRGVEFHLGAGEIFGIVGESGCGKSITCRALMGLLPRKAQVTGTLTVAGRSFDLSEQKALQVLRGRTCAMIFQDPMSALNPLMTVQGHLSLHLKRNGRPWDTEAVVALLRTSGMSEPARFLKAYPHQLSGGQSQRVAIAIALSGQPDVLIADEPTTALDVVLQAQILEELQHMAARTGMSIILISHDIGVIAKYCHRAAVMYAGDVVETGDVDTLFRHPTHPYTKGLINALPLPSRRGRALEPISGEVPKPGTILQGCTFAPRCDRRVSDCDRGHIPMQLRGTTKVRCLVPQGKEAG